jgi:cytochrome P450
LAVLAKFPNKIAPWKHGLGSKKNGGDRGRPFYYALAEEAAANENQQQCYAKKVFDEAPKYDLSKEEIASLNGALFGAGSDTSSSTLVTFFLACTAFPETLPQAWEELDRVVGPGRSPLMEDEPDLPYVKAFVKEVFRWRSVAIIGGQPHAPIQEDTYKVPQVIIDCVFVADRL